MKEVTANELKSMMDNKENFQLIDVREPFEYDLANIGGELIPMAEVMENTDKIAKDKPVIVHCKGGTRSGAIIQALESKGFTNLYNLKGGIMAYADQVDPTITKY